MLPSVCIMILRCITAFVSVVAGNALADITDKFREVGGALAPFTGECCRYPVLGGPCVGTRCEGTASHNLRTIYLQN